jgi:hypothetical protein
MAGTPSRHAPGVTPEISKDRRAALRTLDPDEDQHNGTDESLRRAGLHEREELGIKTPSVVPLPELHNRERAVDWAFMP